MGILRRLFSVGTGLAAGVLAYKLLDNYNQKVRLEGEFRVLSPEEEAEQEAYEEEILNQPLTPEEQAFVRGGRASQPDQGPNPNPVTLGGAEKPLGPDGKIDPTKVASAEDFGSWDDLGCQG